MPSSSSLPFLSAGIPGTGGGIKQRYEDFVVEEIPAYEATGEGDHVIAVVRKRSISTFELVKRLANALGVSEGDIGTAGLKDRQAVTTQQVSLPPPTTPEAVSALELEDIVVVSAARHNHKLRTGHLRGNRFQVVIRDCALDAEEAASRAVKTLEKLGEAPGAPNWFGQQRFGSRGENAGRGRDLLTGAWRGKRPRGRILRLYLSAIQSQLFNDCLVRRVDEGHFRSLLEGDILKKTDSGGVFASEDIDTDSARMVAGEVVATGPMFGPKMRGPAPGTEAARLEQATLADSGLDLESFSRFAKLTPGTRRPIAVALGEVSVTSIGEQAIEVSFTLPSGSYATTVLREIIKPEATPDTP